MTTLTDDLSAIYGALSSALILNYRHSPRRRSSIVFRTAREFASPGTDFPGYPHVLPHPPGR
jgi:hypothetical protein